MHQAVKALLQLPSTGTGKSTLKKDLPLFAFRALHTGTPNAHFIDAHKCETLQDKIIRVITATSRVDKRKNEPSSI